MKRRFDVASAIGGLIVFALPMTAVHRLGWDGPACDFRWNVPPGLTGLAQIVGTRPARHALRLDRRYIARRSVRLDVWVIAWSFAVNLLGKPRVRRILRS